MQCVLEALLLPKRAYSLHVAQKTAANMIHDAYYRIWRHSNDDDEQPY
jgi:hypothetical protein